MKVSEIIDIGDSPDVDFNRFLEPLATAEYEGHLEDLTILAATDSSPIYIYLVDKDKNPAVAVALDQVSTGVFSVFRTKTYSPFQNRKLAAKLYRYLKDQGLEIRSDDSQTSAGRALWTKSLPSIGIKPEIYDTFTGKYYPYEQADELGVYKAQGESGGTRYVWAIK